MTAGTGIAVESRESYLEPVLDIVRKLRGGEWPTHLDQQLQAEDLTADERCLVPEASPAPVLRVLQRLPLQSWAAIQGVHANF